MPCVPMEMPSETVIVLKTTLLPPASSAPAPARSANPSICMLQGVTMLQVEAMPTCGLEKSSSLKPTARSMAPARSLLQPVNDHAGIPPGIHFAVIARRLCSHTRFPAGVVGGSGPFDVAHKNTASENTAREVVERLKWSGRLDLNQRPLAPHASALPGCATPRPSPAQLTDPPSRHPYGVPGKASRAERSLSK